MDFAGFFDLPVALVFACFIARALDSDFVGFTAFATFFCAGFVAAIGFVGLADLLPTCALVPTLDPLPRLDLPPFEEPSPFAPVRAVFADLPPREVLPRCAGRGRLGSVREIREVDRILLQLTHYQLQRFFHLRIVAGFVVLWLDIDVVVGIGPVVFNTPTNILEPERELGLCRQSTIDKTMPRMEYR